MTKEEILLAKKKYENNVKQKAKLKELREEIKEIENEKLIQEYLYLFKRIDSLSTQYENKNLLLDSFYKYSSKTKESNNIFVYMGAYQFDDKKFDRLVDYYDADYLVYEDLETGRIIKADYFDQELVERYYKVIKFNLKEESRLKYKNAFVKLRERFFELLLTMDQEQAVEELMKENKKIAIENNNVNLMEYKKTPEGVKAEGYIGYRSLLKHRYLELYNNKLDKTERYIASKFGPNYFDLKTNEIIYTVGSSEKTMLNEYDMQSVLQDIEIFKDRYSSADIDEIIKLTLKNKGKVKIKK